jgi:hypothetical protein
MRDRAQQEAEFGVHDHLVGRDEGRPAPVIRGDGKTVAAAAADHSLGPAGQPGFQQPGRVEQVRDLSQRRCYRRRYRRPDPHLFVQDPPALFSVADEGLEPGPPSAEHIVDPVPVRTADAQPGYPVVVGYRQGRRVRESTVPAKSHMLYLVRELREHRAEVTPFVPRGLDPRRLAALALVQQVQHLVADGAPGRHGLVLRHRRLGLLVGRLPERVGPRLKHRAQVPRGQARRELGQLPAGTTWGRVLRVLLGRLPAGRRPELRFVSCFDRIEAHAHQLGQAQRPALEYLLLPQHDAQLGIHGDLNPVYRPTPLRRGVPEAPPWRRHHPQPVSPEGGRRSCDLQRVAVEQP